MKWPRLPVAGAGGVALAVAIGLPLVGPAAATSPAPQPLQIWASSLVQDGKQIVWDVQLAETFSPGALVRAKRALCLLIEVAKAGVVTGKACVVGPAKGSSTPRLVYMKVSGNTAGPATPVVATITRGSPKELTASFLPAGLGLLYAPVHWQVVSTLRAAGCAPRAPRGGGCFQLYPRPPALLQLHLPAVVGCVATGASLVYHGPTRERDVALTFDDGPWADPPTIQFLKVLEHERVPATFFEIGRQIPDYDPDGAVERQMLQDGDMIGDHSWSHPDLAALSPAGQWAQLLQAAAAIRTATGGFTPCLWRPPYGDISPSLIKLARSLGLITVMWNVDPRDWALPGVDAIYSNVIANARAGAIVIQHVGGGPRLQTLAALPREIDALRSRGYHFVTVAQMLGLKLVYR